MTQPLGLAGFCLFLVFSYLGRLKRPDERRWPSRVAFGLAAAALVGGLAIAYVQAAPKRTPAIQTAPPQVTPQPSQVQQTSSGPGSPNVQGVNGDVVITVDQSADQKKSQKPKPEQR